MRFQFVLACAQDTQSRAGNRRGDPRAGHLFDRLQRQSKIALPRGHGQIHVGQQVRMNQGPVQFTMLVVHAKSPAQRIQVVLLPWKLLASQLQGIENSRMVGKATQRRIDEPQFRIEEADIEARVMRNDFRAGNKAEECLDHISEAWLVEEEAVLNAMHCTRTFIDRAIRVQIHMPGAATRAPLEQFDTTDLDDPMAFPDLESGRFGIQYDLSHLISLAASRTASAAIRARLSTRSFSACPACPRTHCHWI